LGQSKRGARKAVGGNVDTPVTWKSDTWVESLGRLRLEAWITWEGSKKKNWGGEGETWTSGRRVKGRRMGENRLREKEE